MIIVNCDQRTEQWHKARAGVVTASNFNKVITSAGKRSQQRKSYMHRLAAELILSKYMDDAPPNFAMQRGIEMEESAFKFFNFFYDKDASKVGFVLKDEHRRIGGSPDGLILSERSGLEIKCPLAPTQIGYLDNPCVPSDYILQVQGNMWVCGSDSWYFLSYHPDLDPLMLCVEPDLNLHEMLENEIGAFIEDLDELVERIGQGDTLKKYKRQRYGGEDLPWDEKAEPKE